MLTWSLDEILAEAKKLEKEQSALREELLKICWYMRGGVTLDEAYAMSYQDRSIVGDIVKDNMETTKKSGLPFF